MLSTLSATRIPTMPLTLRVSCVEDQGFLFGCVVSHLGNLGITSARSTRLGADYSYEDSGSCVSGEEEGGIV